MKKLFIILLCLTGSISLYSQSFNELKDRADKGDLGSTYEVASRYYHGKDGPKLDHKQSFNYFTLFNERIEAIWNDENPLRRVTPLWNTDLIGMTYLYLGMMYYEGEGTLINKIKAFDFLLKSAKRNIIFSYYILGLYYATDKDYKNLKKSAKWTKLAYESDDVNYSEPAKEIWEEYELWKYE